MDLRLAGKTALVTGGSRGLGKSVARLLAMEGVDCAICARTEGPLRETADELARETERKIVPIVADTSSEEDILAMVAAANQALGGVDILVNNAARIRFDGDPPENFETVDTQFILQDFEQKFLGYFRCARAVIPHMKEKGWGRIINISGIAARQAGGISTGARNVAIAHMTKSLSRDLGPHGINVNVLYPGQMMTEIRTEDLARAAGRDGVSVEQARANAIDRSPIRHLITPEDVAAVVAFLASPLSVTINGDVIDVTGGNLPAVYY